MGCYRRWQAFSSAGSDGAIRAGSHHRRAELAGGAEEMTIDWSAESASFAFHSESPNPDRNLYAIIAHEQNGAFFHLESNEG